MASLTQGVTDQLTWDGTDNAPSGRRSTGGFRAARPHVESERKLAQLVRTIEGEIIPRLMLAWRAPPERMVASPTESTMTGSKSVVEFTGLILADDFPTSMAYVQTLRAKGVTLEMICLDLLAPTARRLGDLWNDDLCDFTQVTLGLCRLHRVLRELDPGLHNELESRSDTRRALLVPVPGEQHSFGLLMVTEFFRCAGWDVSGDCLASDHALVDRVHDDWFAVAGFSLSCERHIDILASSIRTVRRASCNRAIGILVGGQLFNEHPELVARVGADATAVDGRQAAMQAENLLALLSVDDRLTR